MEKEKLEEKLKQDQQIPALPNCIAYLVIVISVTIFLFYISEYFWLRVYTTQGASAALNLFGFNSSVSSLTSTGQVFISVPGHTFEVIKICSGIEAIALISGLILATRTSWTRKMLGTLFITFGIFGANILRIVTTVVLATQGYEPYIYHEVVSAIFTIIFIIVFILMIQAWIIPNFIDSLINVLVGIVRAIKGTK
ncbi:MAG: exosortase/archaeosortase family protein [Candidatus Helarchaeota archaeon]|nr:exosortase/archaeosortase family protein [Candidatus Helarchaeota archaeon]